MRQLFFFLILFFILVFEGIALKLLPEAILNLNLLIVPHWLLIVLIFLNLFYDDEETYETIVYASIFGLLVDVIYTNILGVYMFTYPVALYVVHLLKQVFQTNIYTTILMATISLIITEVLIHFIYFAIDVTNYSWIEHLFNRLIPTILANITLLVIVYPMLKFLLIRFRLRTKSS